MTTPPARRHSSILLAAYRVTPYDTIMYITRNWSSPSPQNPARNIPAMRPISCLPMPRGIIGSSAFLSTRMRRPASIMHTSAKARLS